MFDSIIIVCTGNICRSPIGDRLLKKKLPEKHISSAGVKALVGESADKTASSISLLHDLSLDGHIAQQLTPALCRQNDLILVMEKTHIDIVSRMMPETRGKIMLFGHWINQREIPDPYRKSRESFEIVFRLLEDSAQKWAEVLSR